MLKRKLYKLYPRNCWDEAHGIIDAYTKKSEAVRIANLAKKAEGVDLEVVTFESKEEQ